MRPGVPEDVEILLKTGLRDADIIELRDGIGMNPHDALWASYKASGTEVYTMTDEGKAVAMFGVAPFDFPGVPPGVGNPWFLGTNEMYAVKQDFMVQCKDWVELMQHFYPVLVNWVDDRNEVSKKWLQWCGFKLLLLEPYGHSGQPFWRFERRR